MKAFLATPRRRASAAGVSAALLVLLAGLATTGCGGSGGSSENGIAVVGYSAPGSVFEEVLEPAFQKTPQGKDVTFTNSFGPSTDQSRSVAAGQPASVVNFAQAGDMELLVEEGLVSHSWPMGFSEGRGENSTVALILRKGNPKRVKTLHDLLTKNVKIVLPNPFSSGAGRWDIMALYGSFIHEGRSHQGALNAIKAVLEKTVAQPRSAHDALVTFLHGKGDVLLSYESEGINAKREGKADYIVPSRTILTEAPIAVTKDAPPAAKAFVEFIWSDQGQELWAAHGYRPIYVRLIGSKFPTPPDLFAITEFGSWDKINPEFFDEKTGSIAKIEQELGTPVSG
jgi:ABC-type sulfate transport system substrate-binding protein